MQKFGEMCIAIYRDNTEQDKLANHSTPGIYVGYAYGHPTGTYQAFNPKTKKIILTRYYYIVSDSKSESDHKNEKSFLVKISMKKSK